MAVQSSMNENILDFTFSRTMRFSSAGSICGMPGSRNILAGCNSVLLVIRYYLSIIEWNHELIVNKMRQYL